eukprot:Lankesteria_metandrocarpae@DN5350_c0_g1_i2.p1
MCTTQEDHRTTAQLLRTELVSLDSACATPCRVVGRELVVWRISHRQHHDLLSHFGKGFYLVSALPPALSNGEHLITESSENQNELMENELAMGRSLITGVGGVVFAGRLHTRLQSVLNIQSPTNSERPVVSSTTAGVKGVSARNAKHISSSKKPQSAMENSNCATKTKCIEPMVGEEYTWSSSPLGLHLASSSFEFHISEDYLVPVQLQVVQRVLAELQHLWACSSAVLNKNISGTSAVPELQLPLIFYVNDHRAEKFQWNISALETSGLAYTSDFRKLLYFGVVPAKNTDMTTKGVCTEVVTISTPLQVTSQTPQIADLDAVIVCPLQNSSSFQQTGMPWRSASTLLDLCFPKEFSPSAYPDSDRSYKVFIRYDASAEDSISDSRPASVAAREGPLLSLTATFSCNERKLQQLHQQRPSRRGSITGSSTASGGLQKVSSSSFGDATSFAAGSAFYLQPALNLGQLLPVQLDTASVLIRAPTVDSSDALLYDMTEDLDVCGRLIQHVQQNMNIALAKETSAISDTDSKTTADGPAWIRNFTWSVPTTDSPAYEDNSVFNTRSNEDSSIATLIPQQFLKDVESFFDEERNRTMAVSTATTANVTPVSNDDFDVNNGNSDLEQDGQTTATRVLFRADADFVDRLWQFIRLKVTNYTAFRVLVHGLLNVLVPSALDDSSAVAPNQGLFTGALHRGGTSAQKYNRPATLVDFKNTPLLPNLRRDSTATLLKTLVQMATLLGQLEVYGGEANSAERSLMKSRWRIARAIFSSPVVQLNLFAEVCLDSLQTDVVHALQQVDSTVLSPSDASSSTAMDYTPFTNSTRATIDPLEENVENDYSYFLSRNVIAQKGDCANKLVAVLEQNSNIVGQHSQYPQQQQQAGEAYDGFVEECLHDLIRQSDRIKKLSALQVSCGEFICAFSCGFVSWRKSYDIHPARPLRWFCPVCFRVRAACVESNVTVRTHKDFRASSSVPLQVC